jgi:hypothetical protein
MGARSSGSKPSAKDATVFAALLTEQSRIARGALVDDGRLRDPCVQAELELVGWSLTQTKTTLAAGVGAIGFVASRWEVVPTDAAYPQLVCRRAIVTSEFSSGGGYQLHQGCG